METKYFSTSNFFYTSKVDVYEPMLDQVMALLKKEQVFFTQAKKIKDSIFNDSIKKKKITKDTKEKEFEKFEQAVSAWNIFCQN